MEKGLMPCLPEHGTFSGTRWAPDGTLKTDSTYITIVGTERRRRNEEMVLI